VRRRALLQIVWVGGSLLLILALIILLRFLGVSVG
jgi:hypothetical protein